MDKLQVKKIIFVLMGVAMVGLTTYGMISGKIVPSEFVALTSSVFGYYYGYGKGREQTQEELEKEDGFVNKN